MFKLAQEIDETKGDLYSALDAKKSLINQEVYLLSSKLDKLIFEYQLKVIDHRI
ncbi:MAG: aspartyl-phosphate phosphatase Spo0E family protein [Tepidanaerobacteraceae bacterium]|nr:aspartyl-phosphate phosphatase Spo0E family protein [Tepidanaerobacteraceae bacterium]